MFGNTISSSYFSVFIPCGSQSLLQNPALLFHSTFCASCQFPWLPLPRIWLPILVWKLFRLSTHFSSPPFLILHILSSVLQDQLQQSVFSLYLHSQVTSHIMEENKISYLLWNFSVSTPQFMAHLHPYLNTSIPQYLEIHFSQTPFCHPCEGIRKTL